MKIPTNSGSPTFTSGSNITLETLYRSPSIAYLSFAATAGAICYSRLESSAFDSGIESHDFIGAGKNIATYDVGYIASVETFIAQIQDRMVDFGQAQEETQKSSRLPFQSSS
eukprot:IDg12569t1